jgi:hypothetical protein
MIGFALINLYPLIKTIFIDYLCIDEPFHGKGLGKLFLTQHVNRLYPSYVNMILECEPNLVPFYEKCGLKKIPLLYPLDNLMMMCKGEKELYHQFIQIGIQFNSDPIQHYYLNYLNYICTYYLLSKYIFFVILCFKATHT